MDMQDVRLLAKEIGLVELEVLSQFWQHAHVSTPAATAASFLLDLLHMRVHQHSLISSSHPDDFVKILTGKHHVMTEARYSTVCLLACWQDCMSPAGAVIVFNPSDKQFLWRGQKHNMQDLEQALSLLLRPKVAQANLLGHQFAEPHAASSWTDCSEDVLLLLSTMAASQVNSNVSSVKAASAYLYASQCASQHCFDKL